MCIRDRPIIVGFGPSGMYAGLILAESGLNPIIIERGQAVEQRTKDINEFFTKGKLLESSNVQFGEGGAGTFSDGKLTTRMKNIRVSKVYEEFIEAGANPAIQYQQRPHLGTDVLQTIVKKIREKIIRLGGEMCIRDSRRGVLWLISLRSLNNKTIRISLFTSHFIPVSYTHLDVYKRQALPKAHAIASCPSCCFR